MSRFIDTLLDTAHANAGPNARGMTTGEPHTPRRRTWAEVHERARRMASGLADNGVEPGVSVAMLAADPASIAPCVQAVWLSGGSVTMLHQPTARTNLADWSQDTLRVLDMIGARLVLLGAPFDGLGEVLTEHGITFAKIDQLDGEPGSIVEIDENTTALLQLTSGSTAEPKAVRITHGNLYSNMRAMVIAAELSTEHDVLVSWLPLFHDMGMVGCMTVPMAVGLELVKVTPADFLDHSLLWPELITRYGGTVTAAPNFAYAITAKRLSKTDDDTYDLSSLRFALNGAEPIDPASARAFLDAGARFGLSSTAMVCAFGMAEVTLAVSFSPLHAELQVDRVDADELERFGRATPATSSPAREFPLLGKPLPGLEVSVVDENGATLDEREVGELRVRGEAVTPGYLTVSGPLLGQDDNGWLTTGDQGYLVEGQVVICGRRKDVIIMGGRNIYPTDIERAAEAVDGVRAGNAVAVRIPADGTRERFAVLVESRLAGDTEAERTLRDEVIGRVVDAVAARPSTVRVLTPGALPKTPSGKLRRGAAAELL